MKKQTFGEKLKHLRAEAGLTQMQVAERAGVPLTTLRNWEHGRREPLMSALFKLADALGVDCSAFKDCIGVSTAEPPPAKKTRKRKGS